MKKTNGATAAKETAKLQKTITEWTRKYEAAIHRHEVAEAELNKIKTQEPVSKLEDINKIRTLELALADHQEKFLFF